MSGWVAPPRLSGESRAVLGLSTFIEVERTFNRRPVIACHTDKLRARLETPTHYRTPVV